MGTLKSIISTAGILAMTTEMNTPRYYSEPEPRKSSLSKKDQAKRKKSNNQRKKSRKANRK